MNRCWIPGWQFSATAFDPLRGILGANDEQVLRYAGNDELSRHQWVRQQALAITVPTTLVGWSLGGMLACEIALQNPLVTQLQLLNTNVTFAGDLGLPFAVAENFMQRYQRNAEATRKRFSSLVDSKHSATLEPYMLKSDELSKLQWLYDIDLQGRELKAAVNVLLAEQDQLVPSNGARIAWQQMGANVSVLAGQHSQPILNPNAVASWMLDHG